MKTSEVIKDQYTQWQRDAIAVLGSILLSKRVKAFTLTRKAYFEEPSILIIGLDENGVVMENAFSGQQFNLTLTDLNPETLTYLMGEVEENRFIIDEEI